MIDILAARRRVGRRLLPRHWRHVVATIALAACLALAPAVDMARLSADSGGRPNVVLVMTDNHGAWTLGCYGNPDIRTPHIDRLAAEGTLFTRAFASNPVCSPTRATFLTGLIPSQHGVHSFLSGGNLQVGPDARCTLDAVTSLPEVLRDSGYSCGLVGKWHLGDNLRPQEGLRDYWITMPHGGTSTFYDAPVIENGAIRKEPKYLTDLWTEHALKFIEGQVGREKPFFLFLAYNGPYALGRLLLREGRNRHAEYYADKAIESFPREPPHPWQLNNRDFINNPTSIRRVATEVSGVDDGVGAVMSALQENGFDDNTIVVFVADQGWVGGHGGFFGMGDHTRPLTARDGMMQIPTIWRHPGRIAAGVRSDRLVTNYDFMPTLLGHLGLAAKMPQSPRSPGVDYSRSLAVDAEPIPENRLRDAVFYEFENLRCVRTGTHKYVHRHPNGPHELYNLIDDPNEFVNLVTDPQHQLIRGDLRRQLFAFYDTYAEPKYDLWKGGTSQVRIHDGIDEEFAQLASVEPPPLSAGFQPAEINVPDGFTVQLAAGPPLVTHPTMACFDDRGRLYVCDNAGVNMTNEELEAELPNSIRMLTDTDMDGRFDKSTVFADKMTFPMGGTWHDGSLYVASPPNIWRLRDTDQDGVADQREIIVEEFGYNGNAASIHGCFSGPDGRIYWTDGYHGHRFEDAGGNVTSQREGSYLFSCRPDGSDTHIHCGGGMDNPVEIDFTDGGDLLGTVNILYTRPRVDALVHWLHGGAYPHRDRVLQEIKVTGDLLGPAHRFGHVAVSGLTRYRSGAMDHRWGDQLFATFFNLGKVVRLETRRAGSSYDVTQHEFLTSSSRDFHPTDVLEDADGSLLVIDTGGWFYRGCPTSQFSKPDVWGGIYRVRRAGMTPLVDPRGSRIDWDSQTPASLMRLLNDTRFAVRQQAIAECARRGAAMLPTLASTGARGDARVRQNAIWAVTRLAVQEDLAESAGVVLTRALADPVATIRQAACRGISHCKTGNHAKALLPLLGDSDASVRRTAAMALGKLGDPVAVPTLVAALRSGVDRSEDHAITYALIEIGSVTAIRKVWQELEQVSSIQGRSLITAIDQIDPSQILPAEVFVGLGSSDPRYRRSALRIVISHPQWADDAGRWIRERLDDSPDESSATVIETLLPRFIHHDVVAELIGDSLTKGNSREKQALMLGVIAAAAPVALHPKWSEPLHRLLNDADEAIVSQAISAIANIQGDEFSERLKALVSDAQRPSEVRVAALSAITARSAAIDDETFSLLLQMCSGNEAVGAAGRGAEILGAAKLTDSQLQQVAEILRHATPSQLKSLMQCFTRTRSEPVIDAFVSSVGSADALLTLTETELSEVIKRYPQETLPEANRLLEQLRQHQQKKQLRLEELRKQVRLADSGRGKATFMSEKAKCSSCHRVGDQGKRVGPDLTTIGSSRSTSDLLESIVFPSASIVRDYDSCKILTEDGRVLSGVLVSESVDGYLLQQASGETVSVGRDEVEQIQPSIVSMMPAGLDEALSESELADVVAYLQSLRQEQP
jgi:putative membrane-bound dehydrogenase-like protein